MRAAWLAGLLACAAGACAFHPPSGPTDGGAGGDDGPSDAGPDGPCADADADGVCDSEDRCPGSDDRIDTDQDGIPDGCDGWPCGALPDAPVDPMIDSAPGRQWTAAFILAGDTRRVVADPDAMFSVGFGWSLRVSCGLPTCAAQLEYGYDAARAGCLAEVLVFSNTTTTGGTLREIRAPATPGVHALRLNAGQRGTCGASASWFGGDPGPESTIALVCVRP